jgi:hypothetical protein
MSTAHDSAHRWLDRASDAVRNTGHQPLPTNPGELYDYLGVLAELAHRLDSATARLAAEFERLGRRDDLKSDDGKTVRGHVADVVDALRHDVGLQASAEAIERAHSAASHLGLDIAPRDLR